MDPHKTRLILFEICLEVNWHQGIEQLLKRMQKTIQNQSLSVREVKLLRKLLRSHKGDVMNLDINDLMYHFPGKGTSLIQNAVKDMLRPSESSK